MPVPVVWCRLPSICLVVIVVLFAGCDDAPSDAPYVEFTGGGFIFNYRLATAEYGFVVRMRRQPPTGTVLEASFEDPAGGPPLVVRAVHAWRQTGHSFQSPPVTGVRAGRDYRVELRLLVPATGGGAPSVLATYTKTLRSELDQSALPDEPLAPGPGYRRRTAPGG